MGSQAPRIALAELVKEPWVLPPPEGIMGPAHLDVFRASGLDYPRIAVFADPAWSAAQSRGDRALSYMLQDASTLRFSTAARRSRSCLSELQHARAPVGIVTLKNRTLSPVAQLFIENAREVAKPLGRRKW